MSTDLKLAISSISSANTEQIAAKIGKSLRGGEVIELISDLGGGKTVFAKGLTSGAGSQDTVASPTFTISKVYKCPTFEIHHFDFYRLNEPGIIAMELGEVINDPTKVTLIEWGGIVENILPPKHIKIKIDHQKDNNRCITIYYDKTFSYLFEGLTT
jgi:tRNA threonylcarbamoyladenosine biosynthesis protein TsaE